MKPKSQTSPQLFFLNNSQRNCNLIGGDILSIAFIFNNRRVTTDLKYYLIFTVLIRICRYCIFVNQIQ